MEYGNIKFWIKNSNEKNFLKVILKIDNLKLGRGVQLYKGKVKIHNINCSEDFSYDENFIYINNNNKELILEYDALIGSLGKHGNGGEIKEDLVTFMGEQIIILPVEILAMKDSSTLSGNIELDFSELKNNMYDENCELEKIKGIIPFKENGFKCTCINANWSDLYEIMKSSYTFGFFNEMILEKIRGDVKIFNSIRDTYFNSLCEDDEIIKNIKAICNFYFSLFKINHLNKKNLNIILLRKSKKQNPYILGGSGRSIISATFDSNKKRDWQLLSHRIFHAFMDDILISRDYHLPPNLWLTEGLATYYENLALESLDDNLKEKLGINFNKEIAKLNTRYVYMTLKEPNRFNIIPMEEGSLKSHGKIEFLHYTKSPLLIYIIENSDVKKENQIINYLIDNKEYKFSMEALFYKIFGVECNKFAVNYLFGNNILPLWELSEFIDEKEIIDNLEEYEYILWTWFLMEENGYIKDDLYSYNKKNLENKVKDIKIYNSYITNQIEKYSDNLSFLLKVWILRSEICNVSLRNINIRYELLKDNINVSAWENFVDRL